MKERRVKAYLALRLLALDITHSVSWLLACSMAFWGFADWIANSWAFGIIAFPATLWVALGFINVLQFACEHYNKQQGGDQYPHLKITIITRSSQINSKATLFES